VSRPLGPDSDLVCRDLERDVSITTQLLREKPGGGPSGTRTSDRSCTVRHATQPHRLRFRIQSRPKRQHRGGVIDFVASPPARPRATSRERGGSIGTRSPRVWPSWPSRESLRRPSAATRRPAARSWSKHVARQLSLDHIVGLDSAGIAAPNGGTARSQSGQRLVPLTFCMASGSSRSASS
jgi:hypothetical protein